MRSAHRHPQLLDDPSWLWTGDAPPFAVGTDVEHPVHGVLSVVAITRRAPASLRVASSAFAVRVAVVTRDEPPQEVFVDDSTREVRLRPAQHMLLAEDVYLLEAPALVLYVPVDEAVAWGARPSYRRRPELAATEPGR
jgi:hypothetical protein